uniref:Uncharacterized protein n=1 Tax=Takifugu rubripes TaxID=31033 RepID=A0A674MA64_TAKRU
HSLRPKSPNFLFPVTSDLPQYCGTDLSGAATCQVDTPGRRSWSVFCCSYDAFGTRWRILALFLFQKVYYEIDWLKSSCKKKPLDTAFIPMQVPFDAHATMQMFLGSSASWGMGVLVNSWSGVLPNNGYYTGVFTEIGCIPMTFFSYMPTSGWSMISTFNWVLGNTNPMDFAPPSFCAKSKLEVTETPDNMFTALQALALKTKRGD